MYNVRRISITLAASHALFYGETRLVIVDNNTVLTQLARILNYELTLYKQAPHRYQSDSYVWTNMNSDAAPEYYTRYNELPLNTDGYAIMLGNRVVYWTVNVSAAQAVLHFCQQEREYWRKH